jgi:hypothetical protein
LRYIGFVLLFELTWFNLLKRFFVVRFRSGEKRKAIEGEHVESAQVAGWKKKGGREGLAASQKQVAKKSVE